MGKKTKTFDWAQVPAYEWSIPCDEKENVEYFAKLSKNLRTALENRPKKPKDIKKEVGAILDWGGMTEKRAAVLIDCFSNVLPDIYPKYKKDPVGNLKEILRKVKVGNYWRIASWTKILAAAFPGDLFIYDARVALGLCRVKNDYDWALPDSRKPELQARIAEIRSGRNGNSRPMPESYEAYLQWLGSENVPPLPDDIRSVYEDCGFSDEQARKAHAEKMLFMLGGM